MTLAYACLATPLFTKTFTPTAQSHPSPSVNKSILYTKSSHDVMSIPAPEPERPVAVPRARPVPVPSHKKRKARHRDHHERDHQLLSRSTSALSSRSRSQLLHKRRAGKRSRLRSRSIDEDDVETREFDERDRNWRTLHPEDTSNSSSLHLSSSGRVQMAKSGFVRSKSQPRRKLARGLSGRLKENYFDNLELLSAECDQLEVFVPQSAAEAEAERLVLPSPYTYTPAAAAEAEGTPAAAPSTSSHAITDADSNRSGTSKSGLAHVLSQAATAATCTIQRCTCDTSVCCVYRRWRVRVSTHTHATRGGGAESPRVYRAVLIEDHFPRPTRRPRIPPPLRSDAWPYLVGNPLLIQLSAYDALARRARTSTRSKSIDENVARMFSDSKLGADAQEHVCEILHRYSLYVGSSDTNFSHQYHQGLGYIVLLLNYYGGVSDSKTFVTLCNLLATRKIEFDSSEEEISERLQVFKSTLALNCPELYNVLLRLRVSPEYRVLQWFPTMFATILPPTIQCRVFDEFLRNGEATLFKAAVTVFCLLETTLMQCSSQPQCVRILEKVRLGSSPTCDVDGRVYFESPAARAFMERVRCVELSYDAKVYLKTRERSMRKHARGLARDIRTHRPGVLVNSKSRRSSSRRGIHSSCAIGGKY